MFYKYEEEVKGWEVGNKISFPDGVTLSIDNKIEHKGWFWSDEPPTGIYRVVRITRRK